MSFSIANTALNAHTEQLNTISNNIANSATKGFKASRTEFSSMYAQSQPLGSRSAACHKISAKTAKRKTGMGLDLAISGGGFFVVRESSGIRPIPARACSGPMWMAIWLTARA